MCIWEEMYPEVCLDTVMVNVMYETDWAQDAQIWDPTLFWMNVYVKVFWMRCIKPLRETEIAANFEIIQKGSSTTLNKWQYTAPKDSD